jgi:hypothetical protein
MFLHPTLREITLSCMNLKADMFLTDEFVAEKRKSTPLQSLVLIECNIDIQFLDVVLSLPKALKELSIGERLHIFPDCEPSMDWRTRTSAALFLTALQRQAESLRKLTHIGGTVQYLTARETDPEGAARLRSLTALEYLEVGFESHLYYYLRQNGFPPALKTLKLLDAAISLNAGHDIRSMSDIAFKSITTLVTEHIYSASIQPDFTIRLHFSDHSIFRLFVIAHPAEQNRLLATLFLDRPATYKIVTLLKSYKAHFQVSRDTFPSGTPYIPPYMYGEELPIEELMYDSNDYWRFNGIDYQIIDDEALQEELQGKKKKKEPPACIGCSTRGIPVLECRMGGVTPCLPCRLAQLQCHWEEEDEEVEDEDEDEDEDEEDEFEVYVA